MGRPAGGTRQAVEIVADTVQFLAANGHTAEPIHADDDEPTPRSVDDIPF